MRAIIAALGVAAILAGTAYGQVAGAERDAARHQQAVMSAQANHARSIVDEINEAYGTHFVVAQPAKPMQPMKHTIGTAKGARAYQQNAQPGDPTTSWQFGPWLGRYPDGQ